MPLSWARLLWVVVSVHCTTTLACERAAGIVIYTKANDEIQILLADHRINTTRGWGTFGGCVDNGETIAAAALRELHEETRCALPQTLSIDEATPNVTIGHFTSYALKVPHQANEQIANAPPNEHCTGLAARERGPWAWFALDTLMNDLAQSADNNPPFPEQLLPQAHNRWFWTKSLQVIRALDAKNAFR